MIFARKVVVLNFGDKPLTVFLCIGFVVTFSGNMRTPVSNMEKSAGVN